ncbi:GntR family transcriptional regulator [Streptomyces sp. NPDC004610]|uniref:GntR family transcriptional regulator n=1 Tax=unclassified Streptomyces TaxID=2593676 RepID=UPI0033A2B7C6
MGGGSATDRAYEWLRDRIVMGDLPVGSFVEEATVCDATGVSRTPVREAMHRLAGERILQLVPRRGAQVRGISAREVLEAYDARWLIESTAVKSVISQGTDLGGRMEQHLAEMAAVVDEAIHDGSPSARAAYSAADQAFHRTYVSAYGNTLLTDFYDRLWPLHTWMSVQTSLAAHAEQIHAQHKAILDAVIGRDEKAALHTLRQHLRPFAQ